MHIERLSVEGGFLDGVQIDFSSGLNVLIGARGTGKTSIIELLRFATAARNHTVEAELRSNEHIRSVLRDGEVTVKFGDIFDTHTSSRQLNDAEPRSTGPIAEPLIFSQTEIETLGLSDSGRLRLIDSFISSSYESLEDEAKIISAIRSSFKEISAVEKERESLDSHANIIATLQQNISSLEQQQFLLHSASASLAGKEEAHAKIAEDISAIVIREDVLRRFQESVNSWHDDLNEMYASDFGLEGWDGPKKGDPIASFRGEYERLVNSTSEIAAGFSNLSKRADAELKKLATQRPKLEEAAREMRTEIDRVMTGAGQISRQLTQLRTDLAQRIARQKLLSERDRRIAHLRSKRNDLMSQLDSIRTDRNALRQKTAKVLNSHLLPEVKIDVERFGQYVEYGKALTDALRGSGLRYNELVNLIVKSVSPKELVSFVDENNFEEFSDITGIPKDRCARVLSHLKETGGIDFAVARIEDNIRMSLLDGPDYKDVSMLSAGQRCTVILSIILQHRDKVLVIDQPEDHLDNAYIASTVIRAIRARKELGQIIISTHNANIPVLGEAALIVEMTSDGHNGFVQVCEPLDDPEAVKAITDVMEGGAAAFAERVRFYDSH